MTVIYSNLPNHPLSFGTKAETLERLRGKTNKSRILEMIYFSTSQWQHEPETWLLQAAQLSTDKIVVRSSAISEDTLTDSHAGRFQTVLSVPTGQINNIHAAIETVINSMYGFNSIFGEHQVLIQPMVTDVVVSGVVTTRDISTGAPYYCVQYDDESGKTNSITQGNKHIKSYYIYQHEDFFTILDEPFKGIIVAIEELQELFGNQSIDVEFAIDATGIVTILQVRRITTGTKWNNGVSENVQEAFSSVNQFLNALIYQRNYIYGDVAVYSNMADWNPAEMIGVQPSPLAFSLYRYLITQSVWSRARAALGYHYPAGRELMVRLGVAAYINVRESFNSFLPSELPDDISRRIVNLWLTRLISAPELHDKVEFEIAIPSYDLSFPKRVHDTYREIESDRSYSIFKEKLKALTISLLTGQGKQLLDTSIAKIDYLAGLQKANLFSNSTFTVSQYPHVISLLLAECIEWGTLPFAIIARHAFVAERMLRSLLEQEAISPQTFALFKETLHTVTKDLVFDAIRVKNGKVPPQQFFFKYGHLRPGTYDIRSLRYDQMPDFFSGALPIKYRGIHEQKFEISVKEASQISGLLTEHQLPITVDSFFEYARVAIQAREYAKFIFSRHISDILELIASWGAALGYNRDDLAYLEISFILDLHVNISGTTDYKGKVGSFLEQSKNHFQKNSELRLSPLISSVQDIIIIRDNNHTPNFITSKFVRAATVHLTGYESDNIDLNGKIVCIESADPGFDRIFVHNIAGLITKYGGSNSHMGIRCAEFGIPAALGCGEDLFRRVCYAQLIELDCSSKMISSVEHEL